jgi:hypothetical protein
MTVILHSPYFSVSPTEDKTERPPFLHNWDDQSRIIRSAEHPHRTWLPGCILKMVEVLALVHIRGKGLLWWW